MCLLHTNLLLLVCYKAQIEWPQSAKQCVYYTLTFFCWLDSSSQLSFLTLRGIEPLGQLTPFFSWLLLSIIGVGVLTSSGSWGGVGTGATLCLPEPSPWARGFEQFPRMLSLEEVFLAIIPAHVRTSCITIYPTDHSSRLVLLVSDKWNAKNLHSIWDIRFSRQYIARRRNP
jgi:hypothetical protein